VPTPEQVDRVIEVPLHECPTCHVPLCDPSVVVQYQIDLPPIVPIVTQFNIETGYCPCCRQRWQGRHPEQISDVLGAAVAGWSRRSVGCPDASAGGGSRVACRFAKS
jgi:transposase